MVSDEELRKRCQALLAAANLATMTGKLLRKQLEEEYNCDLKQKKGTINEEIERFLQKQTKTLDKEDAEDHADFDGGAKRRLGGPQQLSEEMQAFLGVDTGTDVYRSDVVKAVWKHVEVKGLRDEEGSGDMVIQLDDVLQGLFTAPLTVLTLNKQLARHCKPKIASRKAKKGKAEVSGEGKRKATGFAAPQKLSEELAAVVGQPTASRGECMRLIWDRIKARGLQEEGARSIIAVHKDAELRRVIKADKVKHFAITKHLTSHFLGYVD